ncbi:integrase catalytic domain-containing protein [Trichonephila clavipes]|nr:integrase catalytic domain-containing protein [Trichonephila clavipes]
MKTRKTVREVVMKCVPCRRYSSNSPMSEPVSLPEDRVKVANAFDITGIDLAGPLFTRDGGKVWIVLYTCAIYRAIHLELVSSLSTECFILSLRLFIARRTRPETIYTDNGTNFVGTNSELKNLDWDKIMKETDIKPIKCRDGKVRTLKLKCKNSELIRPIQRVYPLEVPFINNEIVKLDGVPTSIVNEDNLTSNAVIKNKVTRSGRLVKIPERLGLFNEVLYVFE